MSIQSAPYYWVVCDCCEKRCEYDGNFSAWSEERTAMDYSEANFERVGDEDLCAECWCWPEDLPDYPGDDAWQGTDDAVRRHSDHPPITPRKEQS